MLNPSSPLVEKETDVEFLAELPCDGRLRGAENIFGGNEMRKDDRDASLFQSFVMPARSRALIAIGARECRWPWRGPPWP